MKILVIDKCAEFKDSFACAFKNFPTPAALVLMSAQTLNQAKKKLMQNPGIDIIIWGDILPTSNEDGGKLLALIEGYSRSQGRFPPRIISANSLSGDSLYHQALVADCTLICERDEAPRVVRRIMSSNSTRQLLAV
jgi:hypothetical protein